MGAWVTKVKASLEALPSKWAQSLSASSAGPESRTQVPGLGKCGKALDTLIAEGKTGWTSKSLLDNVTLLGYRSSIFVIGKLG